MQAQVVLIIDSRKDISQKYKKIIEQNPYVSVYTCSDINDASDKITVLEPDLIIISDNIEVNVIEIIKEIRQKTAFYRPIITILSKSSYTNDKLNALSAGADDYLSEPIDIKEFSARIFAHLRRRIEELLNQITLLPDSKVTYRVLNRILHSDSIWAIMYIDIDNIVPYNDIYGVIATEKIYKAYSAILKSITDENDFVAHLKDDTFIVITTPHKADKLANLLNTTFDAISDKFYNEEDLHRGYLILSGDEKAGMRIPFVSSSIGVITNEHRKFNNYQEIINLAETTYRKAKRQYGSSYVYDRPRIATDYENVQEYEKKKVLILEKDASLAYLLSTTLEMQGYITKATSNINELAAILNEECFNLIIFDFENEESFNYLDICKVVKLDKNVKVIVSSTVHDKEKVLNTGADLYLPKPYDLITLYNWINKLLSY